MEVCLKKTQLQHVIKKIYLKIYLVSKEAQTQ